MLQSQEIESKKGNSSNLADIHLNTCAVLSYLGKHQEAKNKAMQAIVCLQEDLLMSFLEEGEEKEEEEEEDSDFQDKIAITAIAYHNLAVEHEFLNKVFSSPLEF